MTDSKSPTRQEADQKVHAIEFSSAIVPEWYGGLSQYTQERLSDHDIESLHTIIRREVAKLVIETLVEDEHDTRAAASARKLQLD